MRYLITADLHLRDDRPMCRADDWEASQLSDLEWLVKTANKQNATLLIAGDVFHRPNVSEKLLLETYQCLRHVDNGVLMIAGNHDLPNHMLSRKDECSYGVLAALLAGAHLHDGSCTTDVIGYNWRHAFGDGHSDKMPVAITHQTIVSDIPIAAEKTVEPQQALDWLPNVDLIVAGDIHKHALYSKARGNASRKKDAQVLLVPGCLNIQSLTLKDYQPLVHLFIDGELTPIKVPQDNVRFAEQVELAPERQSNLAESIGRIGGQSIFSLFHTSLKAQDPAPAVKDFINKISMRTTGDPIW